jgi:hypothetical protein
MKRIKKKRTYRMYSADGYHIGRERVTHWKQWIILPVILIIVIFVLDVIGSHASINMINDLPF